MFDPLDRCQADAVIDGGRPHSLLRGPFALGIVALCVTTGCFSERSFPVRPQTVLRLTDRAEIVSDPAPANTRAWLAQTHSRFARALPPLDRKALLTADLARDGKPVDVFKKMRCSPDNLHTIVVNLEGLEHTAQATGPDASRTEPLPEWPGFDDVWIPVREGLSVSGRLGLAQRDGRVIRANCVIILPGLLGDLAPKRTRDVAAALREAGLHVLAVENAGIGRTFQRYPGVPCTFGVLESRDLVRVAEYLQSRDEVLDTGIIGFCWGANQALLAAWEGARPRAHPSVAPEYQTWFGPVPRRPVFQAGVMAFSPVLRFEEIIAQTQSRDWGLLENPVLSKLQGTIRARFHQINVPEAGISGDLLALIRYEAAFAEIDFPGKVERGLDYLRLMPFGDKSAGDKWRDFDMPVVIVQGVNDPLTSAQNVADLFATVDNPNVAAVVLRGGGHIGFAPFARDYFYSLILSFFDPARGPRAVADHRMAARSGTNPFE
ncbi:MAG: hypothetical protein KDA32_04055 [Phycisphaerales bacterium]|nr:hypothetical protein [Phycisphaerales bacterium]